MKSYIYSSIVALLFISSRTIAQKTPSTIVKQGTYTIAGTVAPLVANESITLKPDTWIKEGSNFRAYIDSDNIYDNGLTLSNENFVFNRTFQKPITESQLKSGSSIPNSKDAIENITYFDGLGRPIQQIAIKSASNQKDIVTHITYDRYGRQDKQYLPFVRSGSSYGAYKTVDVIKDINSYYNDMYPKDFAGVAVTSEDFNAYSENIFELSPLNRILEQGAPGKDWKANSESDADHTVKYDWTTNIAKEVHLFKVTYDDDQNENPKLVRDGYYSADNLYVTVVKNENWKEIDGNNQTSKEYKNKQGRVVLKRTYNKDIAHDTYYVYDDFGNLAFVVPPKVDANDGVSAIELSELCYQYKYDYRNRLFEKKIPGKGFESIIYNLRDEVIATQDANLREKKQWLFIRYDDFGRVAYTGIVNNTLDRETLQKVANDRAQYATLLKGLDDIVAMGGDLVFEQTPTPANPNSRIEILTINYYDNYDFTTVTPPTSGSEELFKQQLKENVTSYPTGSKVRVLDTNTWINTINYYDYKGRPIYNYSKNEYLSTIDITVSELDFTGRIMQAKTTHTKNTKEPIVTIDRFEYDHVGRLVSQTQELNNSGHKERITENRYDALGVLTNKKVGGTAQGTLGLQDVAYKYNVRGWLTGINDPAKLENSLFGFTIGYNNPTSGTALFNGNISETIWSAAGGTRQNRYTYNYDALNRITSATSNENNYNLNEVSYDKVGNILGINRSGYDNGFGVIDDLIYKYDTGNKLLSVTDNAPEEFRDGGFKDQENLNGDYKYDANGNMIADGNKRINEIVYNHLNLPISIISGARHESIEYKYDATGVKIEKCLAKKDVKIFTKYAGNFVYQKNTNPGAPNAPDQLQFFNHPEGYIEQENDGSFSYIYQYKDHLGNIRLSYSDSNNDGSINPATEIREEKNYYPFGMQHKSAAGNVVVGRKHNYGFNGKEENYDFGNSVSTLDFGARLYDPAIGRWGVIDALADDEMQIDKSPYAYSWNSPVSLNDPDGNCPWCIGALVGAVTEYAVQVTVNLAKGQSLEDAAFNNVDFVDVAASGVEGALTLGASAVRRVGVRVATEVVKAAIDVNGNGSTDVIGTEGSKKSATSLVVETAIGVAGAEGGDKVAGGIINASSDAAVKTAKSNVTAAAKNLDKANNIVFNGGKAAARGSKAKSVGEAFTSFTAAKEAQAATNALNKTVGQASETTVKSAVGTNEGVISTFAAEKTLEVIE